MRTEDELRRRVSIYPEPRPYSLRDRVFQRYGRECYLRFADCLIFADTVDHVIPQSMGGTDKMSNLRPACRRCNVRKGNRLPLDVLSPIPVRAKTEEIQKVADATWAERKVIGAFVCRTFRGWQCQHAECGPKDDGPSAIREFGALAATA